MALDITITDPNLVEVRISERLTKDDYLKFVPEIESLIERVGKVRILMEMRRYFDASETGVARDWVASD